MATAQTLTFRMEKVFDCTPDELWEAWTNPSEFARWISPFPGLDAEVPELDARPGGRVRFTMIGPDGARYPEEAVFQVVDRPRKLVLLQANEHRNDIFRGFPLTMRVRFEPLGKQTRMHFEHSGYPQNFPMDEAKRGFTACFDKLEGVVRAHR
jgi:uncharacterized protein YndB with AHSA1/START domain